MNDYINFDMCVNDDNGNGEHTGKLAAAHLRVFGDSDTFLNLSCTGREITCRRLDNKHIRVGRRTFPIVGYRAYVGNMRWDSAVVTVETANAIADVLRISGKYEPESGTAELWDRWEAGKPLFCS